MTEGTTITGAGNTILSAPIADGADTKNDDRVSLAPLDPETALRALMAVPPKGDQ